MARVTLNEIREFFMRLGKRLKTPCAIYLLGGSALYFLGIQRETIDIDYTFVEEIEDQIIIEAIVDEISRELKLDIEFVPINEFIPLPPGAVDRKQFIGKFENLEVYIFDLYSIALSKIARGFESDFEDVEFLLSKKYIDMNELERNFREILPFSHSKDIDPKEFLNYFQEIKKWSEK